MKTFKVSIYFLLKLKQNNTGSKGISKATINNSRVSTNTTTPTTAM